MVCCVLCCVVLCCAVCVCVCVYVCRVCAVFADAVERVVRQVCVCDDGSSGALERWSVVDRLHTGVCVCVCVCVSRV